MNDFHKVSEVPEDLGEEDNCFRTRCKEVFEAQYRRVLALCGVRKNYSIIGEGFGQLLAASTKFPFSAKEELQSLIIKDFFGGNETIKNALLEALYEAGILTTNPECRTAALVLRALHFAKFGGDKAGYHPLTEEECSAFLEEISCSHIPVRDLKNCDVFDGCFYNRYWIPTTPDGYFPDAFCHMTLREILSPSPTDDARTVFSRTWNHYYPKP